VSAVFFWIFGVAALLLGVLVILLPNPVHAAVALVGNLICLAALYALLQAHFLAIVQILLYAGAILVLFVFVIMLLNLKREELGRARVTASKIAGVVLLAGLGWVFFRAAWAIPRYAPPEVGKAFGTVEEVGRLLLERHLLGFEVASVLLLAAILGAVAVAKRRLW
jgi:NADH-quinone oxidoreductase subunit J